MTDTAKTPRRRASSKNEAGALHMMKMFAGVEKDVESTIRQNFANMVKGSSWSSPYNTDGVLEWTDGDGVKWQLLLEAKYDKNLTDRFQVAEILAQTIFYLKRFAEDGQSLPAIILLADKKGGLFFNTSNIQRFLGLEGVDWTKAPSDPCKKLIRALAIAIIPPRYVPFARNFKLQPILDRHLAIARGVTYHIRVTPENIVKVFEEWNKAVRATLPTSEAIELFFQCLFQPDEVYLHPTKKDLLVSPNYRKPLPVDGVRWRNFFDNFEQGYKPSEIAQFYAIKDRLMEDDARRRSGAFFTPTLWTDLAHKAVTEALGNEWRNECVVYDPAAGTGNLTRDYNFANLILSTAEAADVEAMKEQGFNPGAEVFQYDFLNPDAPSPFFPEGTNSTFPANVKTKLEAAARQGKRLVLLMNPPYGTAGIQGSSSREGVAKTKTNLEMKEAQLGAPSQQLYAQFMFEAARTAERFGFEKYTIALFSKPTFMSSGSYRKLRNWWYGRFAFRSAFMFQASHFADVSGRWGISFTIWDHDSAASNTEREDPLICTLFDVPKGKLVPEAIGVKILYNSDDREASKWVREPVNGINGSDAPQFKSGLNPQPKGEGQCGTLGFCVNDSNSVMQSGQLVFMLSCAYSRGLRNGGSILEPANWRRAIALYAARKLVTGDWINDKDEYLAPTISPEYEQWVNDAHVYAILQNSNNCTAMRDVQYKGSSWNISNHFFWQSHVDTLALLDTPNTLALHRDCRAHPSKDVFGNNVESTPDPYMARVLVGMELSPEAQLVLEKLNALWVQSLEMREAYAEANPELHLAAWDAGLYQLKHLWQTLYTDEWNDLQAAFKALGDKLRPGVFDHGFLMPSVVVDSTPDFEELEEAEDEIEDDGAAQEELAL